MKLIAINSKRLSISKKAHLKIKIFIETNQELTLDQLQKIEQFIKNL